MYSDYSNEAFYLTNVRRNTAVPDVASFMQYYPLVWTGHVCQKMLGANCTDSEAIQLPSGEYRIRFAALKHFGNANDPADYDIHLTPSFNLVY